ncbi:ester cyclase [Candidatus Nitrosocosmicus hydrocola]|uniref:ester cyclase n=1 Tax=Candidatus Nitrosocosmicus hydrocola TaxID=1826872 RepID=UPI0011E5C484|nr:ester cyclase [Candidatus Nitrosocosmicus hydrocola]
MDRSNGIDKVFDKHIEYEFENKDLEATMTTMINDPYVHHVPTLTGGVGYTKVYDFYKNHFIGKLPKDIKIKPISRTVGQDQVVDEVIVSFTHDREIDYMLPGVVPTGKYVEIPHVVIMKFINGKIAHEHIYWDQASVLVQLGLIDQKTLPITGIQQSKRIKELADKE